MPERNVATEQFESLRDHLLAVAYRMLGSHGDAEDAVQETWVRLQRADIRDVGNLAGWLTTVTSRVCLDTLRSRQARRDTPIGTSEPELAGRLQAGNDPEQEAVLADSARRAVLVVLDTLSPAARVAFVLHDVFGVPFDEPPCSAGRPRRRRSSPVALAAECTSVPKSPRATSRGADA